MCCAGPTHPKTLQGNRESRQVPRPFCLRFAVVSHLKSLCKNNSLLQSAKEMAQCTRINAVARAFLISTEEGGCVAAIFLWDCWETAMRKVSEYERQAAECRKLAAQMKTPEQRRRLEDMADVWDRLARERRMGIVENKHDQA